MSYKAYKAKITDVSPIEGADRIQCAIVKHTPVIVSRDAKPGDVGLFFPAEGVLSHDYCRHNNLYRESSLNEDPSKTGFFENNRRVRTQKFMKQRSCGLFMPLSSLGHFGISESDIPASFDDIKGIKICGKYISPVKTRSVDGKRRKVKNTVSYPDFYEHKDTVQLAYEIERIPTNSTITITAKLHGTSGRYGLHRKVTHPDAPWYVKAISRIKRIWSDDEYEYICGSRRVRLKNPEGEGYHGSEAYRFEILDKLKPFLTPGMTIYGEIVGWANSKPIMPPHDISKLKDKEYTKKYGTKCIYSYGTQSGECDFYVYRITKTALDGTVFDLTPLQLEGFVKDSGLKMPPVITGPFQYDGDSKSLMSVVEFMTDRPARLTEDYIDPTHINEGVVVRVDHEGMTPMLFKHKSFAFRVMEGIVKEQEGDPEDES